MSKKTPASIVLGDHVRHGKKFIPPFLSLLPNWDLIRWVDRILPELLWLALANGKFGFRRGAELAAALGRAAHEASDKNCEHIFCFASSYSVLGTIAQRKVVAELLTGEDLRDLRIALDPLLTHFPECPLRFLIGDGEAAGVSKQSLDVIKSTLDEIFDRTSRPATFCQGNAIYIAFITERLVVNEGLALAEFPKLQDYPDTDLSQRIASGVRAMITGMTGQHQKKLGTRWPDYFWNQGLRLEKCVRNG